MSHRQESTVERSDPPPAGATRCWWTDGYRYHGAMRRVVHADSHRGFSLVEVTAVVVVIGVLTGFALAPFGRAIDRASVRAASDEIATALAIGRQLAIMRSAYVTATLDTLAGTITIECDGDTTYRRSLESLHRVALAVTRPAIRFAPNGLGYGVSNLRVIARRRSAADTIYVSRVGRVRR